MQHLAVPSRRASCTSLAQSGIACVRYVAQHDNVLHLAIGGAYDVYAPAPPHNFAGIAHALYRRAHAHPDLFVTVFANTSGLSTPSGCRTAGLHEDVDHVSWKALHKTAEVFWWEYTCLRTCFSSRARS